MPGGCRLFRCPQRKALLHACHQMAAMGRTLPLELGPANGRSRRVSPIAPNPGEGLLTQPTPAVRLWSRERVVVPRSRHLPPTTSDGIPEHRLADFEITTINLYLFRDSVAA